jgi:DNA/RNA-binding domain of Phe-tRNA-synthetase-like protein
MTMTVPLDTPPVQVVISPEVQGLRVGVVVAHKIQIGPSSSALLQWCAARIADVLRQGMAGGEPRREAIRKMLRAGGFKPAGRNKPAQEYLFRTVSESGSLPAILNAVDVLNVISVQSGLPISLLSAARVGAQAVVRYGQSAERFVFNRSGQELDIEGLICVCGGSEQAILPLGTPIKDSMLGKVTEADRAVLAVLYAPAAGISSEELAHWTGELAAGFRDWCGAADVRESIL